jgi:hypothetical protein
VPYDVCIHTRACRRSLLCEEEDTCVRRRIHVCHMMCVSTQEHVEGHSWKQQTKRVSKETYYSVKRDLLQCQKRPTTVSKETYYRACRRSLLKATNQKSVKRDLLQCQKRPTTVSKETYYSVKRDLLQNM